MAASLYKARLNDAKSNLMNSVTPEQTEALENENMFDITPMVSEPGDGELE